jgi:hypothetical protein
LRIDGSSIKKNIKTNPNMFINAQYLELQVVGFLEVFGKLFLWGVLEVVKKIMGVPEVVIKSRGHLRLRLVAFL